MNNSKANSILAVLAGLIFLALALAGCSNPFLQLNSEAASQAALGKAGAANSGEDVSVPEAPQPMMVVEFLMPDTMGEFYSIEVPAGGSIDWEAVYAEYEEHIERDYLDGFGYGFRETIVEEWIVCEASPVVSYSGAKPGIDVEGDTNGGEIVLRLYPKLRAQLMRIEFTAPLTDVVYYTLTPFQYNEYIEPSLSEYYSIWVDFSIPYPVKDIYGNVLASFDFYHPEALFFELEQYYDDYICITFTCNSPSYP